MNQRIKEGARILGLVATLGIGLNGAIDFVRDMEYKAEADNPNISQERKQEIYEKMHIEPTIELFVPFYLVFHNCYES